MKNLSQFMYFDIDGFLTGKTLLLIRIDPWLKYDTKENLGTKAELVITSDKTDYGNSAKSNNLYEKIVVKVPKELNLPLNSTVKLIEPVANVYGDYRNQLSIVSENLEVVKQ